MDGNIEYVHNPEAIDLAYIPASTFKIPHTLIALEEGVVKDQFDTIKWDHVQREYQSWNSDQTLKTAFAHSCVWCYQRFAEKIADSKYREYLAAFDYGNRKTGKDITTFWLKGNLRISPREQVEFLRKVYLEKLPIKQRSIRTLKDIMLEEKTSRYRLWAKTGWKGEHGWYVGYLESKNNVWFFAHHVKVRNQSDLSLRKGLVMEALEIWGII